MIKKLQVKFVVILMSVVTVILLTIFFTMLIASQQLNKRLNNTILHQALNARHAPNHSNTGIKSPPTLINPPKGSTLPSLSISNERRPILVFKADKDGNTSTGLNQLHFLSDSDVNTIAKLIVTEVSDDGILSTYGLRYLRRASENGFTIAVVDISTEQELLRTQLINSLIIGVGAFIVFLLISIFLSRLAIRPVKIAWQNQKQFISDASHELKTPLTVILSNIDMLQKDAPTDEQNDLRMEHINVEATRMKQLVENMLVLAKSDGSNNQANSLVNFSYLVKDIALVYEPILFDEHKTLTFSIAEDLLVSGDAGRLQQLVHILLDNARKYSSSSGTIRIDLSKYDAHTLQLLVSNTGNLIPKEELENIFLRFYRRDESRSEHTSFGLGLSIAQSIVNEHSGKIWAKSNEMGNHFYVTLPLN